MTITLNWTPALATCPDCGDEHDCVARVTCPVCNYHCGGELAQQWIDFCETLEFSDFLEIGEFSEPEGGRGSVQVESKHTLGAEEEKEFRKWIAEVGEAEEGDVLALVAGCSNPFSPATRFELQEIIEEMEGVMESPETWNQLFDHQRKDVEDALEMAQSALATFDTGDVTWIGRDDDGYWFRYLPRTKAEGK